jgi:hypothetical protein
MTERRLLVDFRYTNDVFGHIRLYEAGCKYAMRRGLAHAAASANLLPRERPIDWMPPSIFRPPEVLTELETVEAENELKALQRHCGNRPQAIDALRRMWLSLRRKPYDSVRMTLARARRFSVRQGSTIPIDCC